MLKKRNQILLAILLLSLGCVYLNSSYWFRLKKIYFFKRKDECKQAIKICRKIIRKNYVKNTISKEKIAESYFDLGLLYAKLNLRNKAIESFAIGSKNSSKIDFNKYYKNNDIIQDKLLAIGLLESGRWSEAIEELYKLKESYKYNFPDSQNFINLAKDLNRVNLSIEEEDTLFLIGDIYIERSFYEEAREFFTNRILDYGIDPLRVLRYLKQKYGDNENVKQKVWDSEIYVVLEDFEDIETQLSKWIGTKESFVYSHRISDEVSYKGNNSEFLYIDYKVNKLFGDYDLWEKTTKFTLSDRDLKLGVRFYVKSIKPAFRSISINFLFEKSGTSGVFDSGSENIRDTENSWKEHRVEDLYIVAERIADQTGWNTNEIIMDKIILNTRCRSGSLFVDEIELFCLND